MDACDAGYAPTRVVIREIILFACSLELHRTCPPGVGERADGWVDGKGEGVGCFVRVYLFRNSSKACIKTYVYICIYIDI